ncbi:hypothetical protein Scep_017815 [Stephania cephalantha]|uniref:Uncharacterized protein n=1 Tax=Stephania cephalantha TaxID=152367 RepID=A0AAP0NTZ8_9MAGN
MDKRSCNSQESEVRKGPWTMEEDLILINYIANHGEGVWNSLARSAGLKRTGKSCRLRWLNYLRPDVRRGNITPEEQLLIMQLHARWGNRWSKIAKHLPGRTDNEIKNFWRTKIQKHVKQADTPFSGHQNNGSDHNQQYHDHGANSSHTSAGIDEGAEHYSSLNINIAHNDHHHNNYNNTSSAPLPPESSTHHESIWSIEDLWSMQLFNGD